MATRLVAFVLADLAIIVLTALVSAVCAALAVRPRLWDEISKIAGSVVFLVVGEVVVVVAWYFNFFNYCFNFLF